MTSPALQLFTFEGDLILTERKVELSKLSINKKNAQDVHFISAPREKSKNSEQLINITPDNNRTLLDLQIKGADVKFIKNRGDLKLRPEFNPPRPKDSELLLIKSLRSPQNSISKRNSISNNHSVSSDQSVSVGGWERRLSNLALSLTGFYSYISLNEYYGCKFFDSTVIVSN